MPSIETRFSLGSAREQIERLARDMGVVVDETYPYGGMMYVEEEPPRIEIEVVRDERSYFIALHELGHVYHGHTQGRPPYYDKTFYFDQGVLKSEAQAWDFALNSAKITIPKSVGVFARNDCLGSYLAGAKRSGYEVVGNHWGTPTIDLSNGNRHWHAFRYGTPDKFFWDTMDALYSGEDGYK